VAVQILLHSYLRPFAGGAAQLRLAETPPTVADLLHTLAQRHPGLYDRVVTERGEIRPHVNLFVGSLHIRDLGGLDAPLADGAEVHVLAAVSGG